MSCGKLASAYSLLHGIAGYACGSIGGFVGPQVSDPKLGRSRWSLWEHTIRISSLCLFWSPPSRLTPPSTLAGTWRPPGALPVVSGWQRLRSQWEAEYGRCTSLACSPSSCPYERPTTLD